MKNKIFNFIKTLLFILLGLVLIDYFGVILGAIILFILTILWFLIPNKVERTIIKLKKELPISQIRDIQNGLVKIKGTIQAIDPLISEIKKKECIAYSYKTEKSRYTRSGGVGKSRITFSTLSNNVFCNPFLIKDQTGEITVSCEDLEIRSWSKPKSNREANKRYTEQRLKNNKEVIIIGKTIDTDNGKQIVVDPEKKVFVLYDVPDS
ncbi:hypothetical protein [uncultured Aquimarina sp.]|uniref:hypothetical protein n=1 Tax=uncultured Aquimarina sp. TaxID=575652 RepID=UPI0026144083|nr:hypothetical protein [uncultured Aquimarina sp.]